MTRRAAGITALAGVLALAAPARAWVERTIKSDTATLDVERSGAAVVSHEILLGIRGGPLSDLVVEPVDADAELLPDPTVTIAGSGAGAGVAIPLTGTKDGTRVSLHIERERGLRTGTYQVRFRYRTDLRASGKLELAPEGVVLRWTGPSFGDGIDAARVVFRLGRAPLPPRLLGASADTGSASIADDRDGVFLSTFRRVENQDELEVVRPHVTRGESVSWNVVADPSAFDGLQAAAAVPEPAPFPDPAVAPVPRRAPPRTPPWLLALAAGSLSALYGLLVACKLRFTREACDRHRATPRALVPMPGAPRIALAGLGVLGAMVAVFFEYPWPAAASLLVAFLAAVQLPPSPAPPLRGPGSWAPVDPDVVFRPERPRLSPARLLDAGTPLGFILFCSLLAAFAALALVASRTSPFLGVAVALSASLLFPVFCTGREDEHAGTRKARDALEWIQGSLARLPRLAVEVIGRTPLGGELPDEIRLLVKPQRPASGLVAIEVGFDACEGALGVLTQPFVIVRVEDGSPAAERLPKGLFWTRGRTSEERVVVLRPRLPTRALARDLARDLARRLTVEGEPRQSERSAARSSGKGSLASKAGTRSSPAHAT